MALPNRDSVMSSTRTACIVSSMARPYADPVEIITAPVPAQSPFIPLDAKIVVGAVAPASPDPIPIVLLPGFEYRMSEWRHPRPTRSTGGSSAERPPSSATTTSSPAEPRARPALAPGARRVRRPLPHTPTVT